MWGQALQLRRRGHRCMRPCEGGRWARSPLGHPHCTALSASTGARPRARHAVVAQWSSLDGVWPTAAQSGDPAGAHTTHGHQVGLAALQAQASVSPALQSLNCNHLSPLSPSRILLVLQKPQRWMVSTCWTHRALSEALPVHQGCTGLLNYTHTA